MATRRSILKGVSTLAVVPFSACLGNENSTRIELHIFNNMGVRKSVSIQMSNSAGMTVYSSEDVVVPPASNGGASEKVIVLGFNGIKNGDEFTITATSKSQKISEGFTVDCSERNGEQVGIRISNEGGLSIQSSRCS